MSNNNEIFATPAQAASLLKQGKMVVLVDDEDRENEGDLIMAAQFVTPQDVTFMIKKGSGLFCMPITKERADKLNLKPMVEVNNSKYQTAFTASVGAKVGITTGISATDRQRTVAAIAKENATQGDIVSPGHVFPLIAKEGGVLQRRGHTEACIDLMKIAGLKECAVLCEVIKEDGEMARMPDLIEFCKEFNLKIVKIADIAEYLK